MTKGTPNQKMDEHRRRQSREGLVFRIEDNSAGRDFVVESELAKGISASLRYHAYDNPAEGKPVMGIALSYKF